MDINTKTFDQAHRVTAGDQQETLGAYIAEEIDTDNLIMETRGEESNPLNQILTVDENFEPIEAAVMPRAEIMRNLLEILPLNEFGLPAYFYRSDLIPEGLDTYEASERDKILEGAIVPISTFEGFPTHPNGNPLWGLMDWESPSDYNYFQAYLLLCEETDEDIRQLHTLAENLSSFNLAQIPYAKLYELFHLNYWMPRARGYDLFRIVAENKQKHKRRSSVEDNMYKKAQLLETKASAVVALFDDEDIELKDAIALMKLAIEMNKLATGVGHHGAHAHRGVEKESVNSKLSDLLTAAAEQSGDIIDTSNLEAQNSLSKALDDPEVVAALQEVMLKVRGASARGDEDPGGSGGSNTVPGLKKSKIEVPKPPTPADKLKKAPTPEDWGF